MNTPKSIIGLLFLISLALGSSTADGADLVLAVTTDFSSSGSLSTLSVQAPWISDNDVATIHSDAVARVHDRMIYVVNRLVADNIQVINPDADFATVQQFSVGAASDPQDIAVISETRAYVSRHNSNLLLEVNPVTGEHLGTISLLEFADPDGLCEMHRMHIDGNYLYVQIQRLNRNANWVPVPPSLLAVIDLNTRQLVDVDPGEPGMQGITLAGLNPIAPMQIDPVSGCLLVPEAGRYAVIDAGGIEAVDLSTWE
ncbi:MAG: hypothetical protein KJ927_09045, partial [Candidatus Eisenbacteria bacterium]|nr:hypothetical protein [Candidatus Eisenbacteria bacterium]